MSETTPFRRDAISGRTEDFARALTLRPGDRVRSARERKGIPRSGAGPADPCPQETP